MTTGVSVIPVGTPDPLTPRPERLIPSRERAASMLPSRTSKKVPWPVGTARSRVSPALVASVGAVPWPTVAWPVAVLLVELTSVQRRRHRGRAGGRSRAVGPALALGDHDRQVELAGRGVVPHGAVEQGDHPGAVAAAEDLEAAGQRVRRLVRRGGLGPGVAQQRLEGGPGRGVEDPAGREAGQLEDQGAVAGRQRAHGVGRGGQTHGHLVAPGLGEEGELHRAGPPLAAEPVAVDQRGGRAAGDGARDGTVGRGHVRCAQEHRVHGRRRPRSSRRRVRSA